MLLCIYPQYWIAWLQYCVNGFISIIYSIITKNMPDTQARRTVQTQWQKQTLVLVLIYTYIHIVIIIMNLSITSGGGGGGITRMLVFLFPGDGNRSWGAVRGKLEQMNTVEVELHDNQNLGVVQLTVNLNCSNTSNFTRIITSVIESDSTIQWTNTWHDTESEVTSLLWKLFSRPAGHLSCVGIYIINSHLMIHNSDNRSRKLILCCPLCVCLVAFAHRKHSFV